MSDKDFKRIRINKSGVYSTCNEFKPFHFNRMGINEYKQLEDWLNSHLGDLRFAEYIHIVDDDTDQATIENDLKGMLNRKYQNYELFDVTVMEDFVIIGLLTNSTRESLLKDVENYLGISDWEKRYSKGQYAFDSMIYGIYSIPK